VAIDIHSGKYSGKRINVDWELAFEFILIWCAAWFLFFFLLRLIAALRAQPAADILEGEISESDQKTPRLFGFVAMECYWLILNRTYLIFVAQEGMYGWRARGPVTNADPKYWEPLRDMLEDDKFMRNRQAIQKLSCLAGGFFLDRSAIISVEADYRSKWGMGGVPHSGHVHVRLASGRSREFILLGAVSPEGIRDRIASVLGGGVTSAM
jgi:hypothetical protein